MVAAIGMVQENTMLKLFLLSKQNNVAAKFGNRYYQTKRNTDVSYMLFHYLRGSFPFLLAMDNYINETT